MGRYSKHDLSIMTGKNIRKYRLIRGYTLQELVNLADFTHGYVRDLECLTVDKTPTLERIGKFADALEIDIRQLFYDVEISLEHKNNLLILNILVMDREK